MSRATDDDVVSYSGIGGEWFKIMEEGVCDESKDFTTDAWCSWAQDEMAATIPTDTPDGEYLMRFEHIGIHRSHVNQPEHYTSCVQVRVTGGGSGTPGPTFTLPGGYTDSDPYATFSIYGGAIPFPMPGPAVWSSGNGGGNSGSSPAPANPSPVDPAEPAEPAQPTEAAEEPAEPANPAPAPPAGGNGGNCAGMYEQCGGSGFTGPTCCSSGTCTVGNDWYSQCL
jgi:hypothetical protein